MCKPIPNRPNAARDVLAVRLLPYVERNAGRRFGWDYHLSQELIQLTMLRILTRHESVGDYPSPELFARAMLEDASRRHFRDQGRRRHKVGELPDCRDEDGQTMPCEPHARPDASPERREVVSRVRTALTSCDARTGKVALMFFGLGYEQKDIAREVGRSESRTKRLCSLAERDVRSAFMLFGLDRLAEADTVPAGVGADDVFGSVVEAAAYKGVDRNTIGTWIRSGKLAVYRRGGIKGPVSIPRKGLDRIVVQTRHRGKFAVLPHAAASGSH